MSLRGIVQPELLHVDETIRLRKYDGIHDFALEWYQDPELVWLVDGVRTPYDAEKLNRMYRFLNDHSELYWIEVLQDEQWLTVGDVAFWQYDMPITIFIPAFRGKGIGHKVVAALILRGRQLGFEALYVDRIFHYNLASRKCFMSEGFQPLRETEESTSFVLNLKTN